MAALHRLGIETDEMTHSGPGTTALEVTAGDRVNLRKI